MLKQLLVTKEKERFEIVDDQRDVHLVGEIINVEPDPTGYNPYPLKVEVHGRLFGLEVWTMTAQWDDDTHEEARQRYAESHLTEQFTNLVNRLSE